MLSVSSVTTSSSSMPESASVLEADCVLSEGEVAVFVVVAAAVWPSSFKSVEVPVLKRAVLAGTVAYKVVYGRRLTNEAVLTAATVVCDARLTRVDEAFVVLIAALELLFVDCAASEDKDNVGATVASTVT